MQSAIADWNTRQSKESIDPPQKVNLDNSKSNNDQSNNIQRQ